MRKSIYREKDDIDKTVHDDEMWTNVQCDRSHSPSSCWELANESLLSALVCATQSSVGQDWVLVTFTVTITSTDRCWKRQRKLQTGRLTVYSPQSSIMTINARGVTKKKAGQTESAKAGEQANTSHACDCDSSLYTQSTHTHTMWTYDTSWSYVDK